MPPSQCPSQLLAQAIQMLQIGRMQVQTTLLFLNRLADRLAPLRGPKHVVMISGGMPFGQDLLPLFDEFARKAAAAQIVFYAVHLDQPESDAGDRKAVASAFGGRDLSQGLTTMTGMTGGAFFSGVGRAPGVFDRIKVEINNYYELGIETLPEDASGNPRDIEVTVGRPGLSVRARKQVTMPDRATVAAWSADPVKTLLPATHRSGGIADCRHRLHHARRGRQDAARHAVRGDRRAAVAASGRLGLRRD